jgi:WD40 repeat protein
VSASYDSTLKVWDVANGQELRTLAGHSGSVNGLALSGAGRRAVSASTDKAVKVWDVESGRELFALEGHTLWVHGVALSGDGRWAVSASGDTTLKLWDLKTGQFITNFIGDAAALCCGFAGPSGLLPATLSATSTPLSWKNRFIQRLAAAVHLKGAVDDSPLLARSEGKSFGPHSLSARAGS